MNWNDKLKKASNHKTMLVMNADNDGCSVTLTTAHHYAGNIISPREGFREMGVIEIYEAN